MGSDFLLCLQSPSTPVMPGVIFPFPILFLQIGVTVASFRFRLLSPSFKGDTSRQTAGFQRVGGLHVSNDGRPASGCKWASPRLCVPFSNQPRPVSTEAVCRLSPNPVSHSARGRYPFEATRLLGVIEITEFVVERAGDQYNNGINRTFSGILPQQNCFAYGGRSAIRSAA